MFELTRALRSLVRRPLWALAAIVTMAPGIGLATAAFSIVYGSILLDLPLPRGEELHRVEWFDRASAEPLPLRWEDFDTLRRSSRASVTEVAAWYGVAMAIGSPGEGLQREDGALVSGELFPLLAVEPLRGRWIGPEEADEPVVVISHELWERVFAGDEGVVGRQIRVWHQPAVIVGSCHRGSASLSTRTCGCRSRPSASRASGAGSPCSW